MPLIEMGGGYPYKPSSLAQMIGGIGSIVQTIQQTQELRRERARQTTQDLYKLGQTESKAYRSAFQKGYGLEPVQTTRLSDEELAKKGLQLIGVETDIYGRPKGYRYGPKPRAQTLRGETTYFERNPITGEWKETPVKAPVLSDILTQYLRGILQGAPPAVTAPLTETPPTGIGRTKPPSAKTGDETGIGRIVNMPEFAEAWLEEPLGPEGFLPAAPSATATVPQPPGLARRRWDWLKGLYGKLSSIGGVALPAMPSTFSMKPTPAKGGEKILPQYEIRMIKKPTVETPRIPTTPRQTSKPYNVPQELKDIFRSLSAQQKSAVMQIGPYWDGLTEKQKKDIEAAIRADPQTAFEILKRLRSG